MERQVFGNPSPDPTLPFYGRETEIADIVQMIEEPSCQLLTLIGPGGIGKTRLAMHVGEHVSDAFYDGFCWVNLQPITSIDFVVPTIAAELGISLSGIEDPFSEIITYLENKNMLLVLDNFETVIDFAENLFVLLRSALDVKLLITSREALQLRQEWVYAVGGLAYPASEQVNDPLSYSAVRLFVDIAQRSYPDINPHEDMKSIIKICQHVEGMPLALEIAASWIRSLSLPDIAEEIQRGLDLLTTRMRNLPQRHRSMQVVFEQTCRMLSSDEYKVFQKLSIFRGLISRDAARQVAQAPLPILASLIDKSLLKREDDEHYRMHELVRQYAEMLLAQDENQHQQTQTQHYTYYMDLLDSYAPDLFEGDQKQAITVITANIENIRFAWQSAAQLSDLSIIARGINPLAQYHRMQSQYQEMVVVFGETLQWLDKSFESPSNVNFVRLILHTYYAIALTVVGHTNKAREAIAQMKVEQQSLGDVTLPKYTLLPELAICNNAIATGNYNIAHEYGQKALAISREQNNLYTLNWAYYALSGTELIQGNIERAREYAEACSSLARERGDQIFTAMSYLALGRALYTLRDYDLAAYYYQTSYQLNAEFGHPDGMGIALTFLADIAFQQGRYDEALGYYQKTMDVYQNLSRPQGTAVVLHGAARAALMLRDNSRAVAYLREALKLAVEHQNAAHMLSLLVTVAEIYLMKDDHMQALPILALIKRHDMTPPDVLESLQQCLQTYEIDETELEKTEQRESLATMIARLLLSFPDVETTHSYRSIPQFQQNLIEPLSEREQEVLFYVSEGLKNREIADKLYISLGTIKSHINSIYGKLQVRNRVEALIRAKELKLL